MTRSDALIAAQKKYDAKRKGKQVSVRLSEEEMTALDEKRGQETRGAFVKRLILAQINQK